MLRLNEVFVAGGHPTVTHVQRPLGAERGVRDYLGEGGRTLLLTGPSRSGKTVLIREVARDAVRVPGGELDTLDEFWSELVDQFGVYTGETAERFVEEGEDSSGGYSGAAKIGGSGIEASNGRSKRTMSGRRHSQVRRRPPRRVAKAELLKSRLPVVVDDFDRIAPPLQRRIVDGLKEVIFEGVPAIFIATTGSDNPGASFVEGLADGEQFELRPWAGPELERIAAQGLAALNVECDPVLASRLALASKRNPCVMQYLCLQLCKANGITSTCEPGRILRRGRDLNYWLTHQLRMVGLA